MKDRDSGEIYKSSNKLNLKFLGLMPRIKGRHWVKTVFRRTLVLVVLVGIEEVFMNKEEGRNMWVCCFFRYLLPLLSLDS